MDKELKTLTFTTRNGKNYEFSEILKLIQDYIASDPEKHYDIMIGTDSENRIDSIDFVTVIAIHRIGLGGIYFYRHYIYKNGRLDLRRRIWEEVNLSLNLAGEAINDLRKIDADFNFELHVDVGPNGATKSMLQEIIQTVRAMGYSVKVKPHAYAASTLADHHV